MHSSEVVATGRDPLRPGQRCGPIALRTRTVRRLTRPIGAGCVPIGADTLHTRAGPQAPAARGEGGRVEGSLLPRQNHTGVTVTHSKDVGAHHANSGSRLWFPRCPLSTILRFAMADVQVRTGIAPIRIVTSPPVFPKSGSHSTILTKVGRFRCRGMAVPSRHCPANHTEHHPAAPAATRHHRNQYKATATHPLGLDRGRSAIRTYLRPHTKPS